LGRLELSLGDGVTKGYLRANGTLRALPPGSRLDDATGQFTWAPGPGYLGAYDLVFLQGSTQVAVQVTIQPTRTSTAGLMHGAVDLPVARVTVTGTFTVAGWALDTAAWQGTGVGAVHVWAQRRDVPSAAPVFLGAADLGGVRPDVAAAFGAQFDRAGWGLVAAGLAPGRYEVTAYFWNNRTAGFDDARTVTVSVR
jgi:hypothetical protein